MIDIFRIYADPNRIMVSETRKDIGETHFLVLLWTLVLWGTLVFGGDTLLAFPVGEAELDRLGKGEVLVRVNPCDGQRNERVEAAILIDATAEPIWKALNDCRQTPQFIPGLKSCQVLQQDRMGELIEHRMKFSWFLPEVKYVYRAAYERYKRIDFKRTSGDLKEFEGSWLLESVDRGKSQTLLICSLHLDLGFLLPQWAVQLILREDLPKILLSLRNRVYSFPRE